MDNVGHHRKYKECFHCSSLNDENILKLIGVCFTDDVSHMVTEVASKGDANTANSCLRGFLSRVVDRKFSQNLTKKDSQRQVLKTTYYVSQKRELQKEPFPFCEVAGTLLFHFW